MPDELDVLIIEDSVTTAARLKFDLEHAANYQAFIASSIEAARNQISEIPNIACVVLDLTLPDADGLSGLKIIRGLIPLTPIVVVTGLDDDELALSALRNGAQDYLVKNEMSPAGLTRAIRFAQERKKAERIVLYQANYDLLTGLASRQRGFSIMEAMISHQVHPADWTFALLYIDLNNFKPINDTYGHATGDEVLKIISNRLQNDAKPTDVICRIGGDEFLYIVTDIDTCEQLEAQAQRVRDVIATGMRVGDRELAVHASVGMSYFRNGDDVADVVARADQHMYSRKHKLRAADTAAQSDQFG